MDFIDQLPRDDSTQYLAGQLRRAANAAAANYRAACRGRSRAEFTAKIGLVAEESDESVHWLEMLLARRCEPRAIAKKLLIEAHELEAIFSSSYGTAKRNVAIAKT